MVPKSRSVLLELVRIGNVFDPSESLHGLRKAERGNR